MWKRMTKAIDVLFRRRNLETDMAEEMRFHREAQVEVNLAAGMSESEAQAEANRRFGARGGIEEAAREARGFVWFTQFKQDLRYGVRMLGKHRAFTVIAVLTLALGLSANITVFSVIDVFFFQPITGVERSEELVVMTREDPRNQFASAISWADYEDYRDNVPGFSDLAVILFRPAHLSRPGQAAHRTWVEFVSPNYFELAGTRPALGRLFLPGEGLATGADLTVILSYRYWRDRLGSDPSVVGSAIMVNGQSCEVVGVAAEDFSGMQWGISPALWTHAKSVPPLLHWEENFFQDRNWNAFRAVGRIAEGETLEQVVAQLATVDQRIAGLHAAGSMDDVVTKVVPEHRSRPDPSVSGFLPLAATVFLGLVLMILLIACANVANLLFARAATRQREMAIRASMGATRGRLTRQLLTESLLLAILAGGAGWGLSSIAGGMMEGFNPSGDIPMSDSSSTGSGWPMVFAVVISLLAGLVTGLLPALRASRLDLVQVIKGGAGGDRKRHWLRDMLVISQVAFCAIVLVAGGLFVRSLQQATEIQLGFTPENLAMASLDLDLQGYSPERGQLFLDELTAELTALPGVESVAYGNVLPMSTSPGLREVSDADSPQLDETGRREGEIQAASNIVDVNFIKTMESGLIRGRDFNAFDTADSPLVVIVNQTLADKLWPGEDPLGRRLVFRWGEPMEVIGVVQTGKYVMVSEAPRPAYLQPFAQAYNAPVTLFLRTRGDAAAVIPTVRGMLQSLDTDLPVFNTQTMEEHLRSSAFGFMPMRMAAYVAGGQGIIGLLLAVMGVYGVVAYSVSQRTREIGIRLALGAERTDVFRLVVRGGLILIVVGLVVGLVIAVGLSLVLSGLLVGLSPFDLPVFAGVAVGLTVVSLLACYLPARRAMSVDPAITLKCE
ncbi:MAG: ABC transporter permease [Opitutaceae bacterium]|jgi:predicted permease|nr:ABC transporter permease [Opitutaceae bacterium]